MIGSRIEINQTAELRISDMLEDGRAFGRAGDLAVFVSGGCGAEGDGHISGAVPGDLVRVVVTGIRKNSAEAELLEIVEPSPVRIEAECPYFGKCGGCTMQELSYEAQLKLKRDQVESKLSRIGGVDFEGSVSLGGETVKPKVHETIGAEALKYYRNKAVFSVGPNGEVGFKRAKTNHVIDIDDCMLQSDAAMVCADALRTFFRESGDNFLCIDQMTVRTAFGTGEIMVVLEADGDNKGKQRRKAPSRGGTEAFETEGIETLVGMLDDAVYSLSFDQEGIYADNLKEEEYVSEDEIRFSLESVALIRSGKCDIVAGKNTITDEFITDEGIVIKYEISPRSFFQVNPEQMVRLYDKVAEYAATDCKEKDITILDLYCGAGTIGIWILEKLRHKDAALSERTRVIGIESVKSAVLDANRNSVINGLTNTRYLCGKAEEELPGMMGISNLYKWNEVNEWVEREPEISIRKADVAILDPPRSGCEEALLEAVVKALPERIIYVSCDAGTLSRDIKYLTGNGYSFIEAAPVDQFPWTSSIEVVAKMQKNINISDVQTTDCVLMVSPVAFGFNEETAENNAFQNRSEDADIMLRAKGEADAYAKMLEDNGIKVIKVEDTEEPHTPDSVFPNNWFSTHGDGTLVLYPMFAENRRLERKPEVLKAINENFSIKRTVDLTPYEKEGMFLEGTGSMVLDRVCKVAYACRSPRTDETVLGEFCRELGYSSVVFDAFDEGGMRIYHTNVMMHIGKGIAVVCMESVRDPDEASKLRDSLESSGKKIIEITFDQMNSFAGNMLELRNKDGEGCLIMSETARKSLDNKQVELLSSDMKLITPELDIIESIGGGSARCMLAEIF